MPSALGFILIAVEAEAEATGFNKDNFTDLRTGLPSSAIYLRVPLVFRFNLSITGAFLGVE